MKKGRKNARSPLSSVFADALGGYIEYKRTELGYEATTEETFYAPNFDRFCRDLFPCKTELDKELAIGWVNAANGGEAVANRASFMRGFARYIVLEGGDAFVLPNKMTAIRSGRPLPHIFTRTEIGAFFGAADSMAPSSRTPARHLIVPVFFRLMYCTGLRPQEARLLPSECFDFGNRVIRVVNSKDHRDRNVVVSDDVAEMCAEYSSKVEALFPGRPAFFPNSTGEREWSWDCMYGCFWDCWDRAGVVEFSGPRPRPYDFRHAFATNIIRKWKAGGIDVHGNLRILQEHMGHAELGSTLYYVHLVGGGLGDPTLVPTWKPANRMEGATAGA